MKTVFGKTHQVGGGRSNPVAAARRSSPQPSLQKKSVDQSNGKGGGKRGPLFSKNYDREDSRPGDERGESPEKVPC